MDNTLNITDNLLACSMCLGGAKGEIAIAANMAIGLMLIFVFLVLAAFLGFIYYLSRKSKLAEIVEPSSNH